MTDPPAGPRRSALLYGIVVLVFLNVVILGFASAVLLSNQYFYGGRFVFTYDETKLAIDSVGGFVYDSQGDVDSFTITVRNKDASNPYSGSLEVTVLDQSFQIAIQALGPGNWRTYRVDLNPNLPANVLAINATIFMGGGSVADLVAPRAAAIGDASIDGAIGAEWTDARQYTGFPLDPTGGPATVWVKNDGTFLYLALQFTADSGNPWIGIQLGVTGCMDPGDLILFGDDNFAASAYRDASLTGARSRAGIVVDATQNGVGAIVIGAGNVVTLELKKPLNSGDTTGRDIAWTPGNVYSMVFVWDTDGGGSSGGAADHAGGTTPTARTILVEP